VAVFEEWKMIAKVRILIVDDNPIEVTKTVGIIRQRWGLNVDIRVARNGHDGLVKVLTYLPDVVLTDIDTPKMHGAELARMVRQKQMERNIPIIGMSESDLGEARILDNLGLFDAFMIKPFSGCELIDKLMILCPALTPSPRSKQPAGLSFLSDQSLLLSL
jgi:CheY-like chemotaxis protein